MSKTINDRSKKRKPAEPAMPGFPVDGKGHYNGKPMSHWDAKADELMIRCLLDVADLDTGSIIGAKAAQRIMNLALAISPALVHKMTSDREDWRRNAGAALSSMIGK